MRPWGDGETVFHPFTPEDPDFYSTDAITERAVRFLETSGGGEDPFFLYLPQCAPHFPMQAREEDIARYEGQYLCGWDELRERRYRGLLERGLIEERWGISARDDICPRWEDVSEKDRWDRKMAVYAAMIDRMDQGIGRVMDTIRHLGKEDDTLVLFLSDNGACAGQIDRTPDKMPGPLDTYTTVDAPWANASNTPFRKYKIFDHEGGISTPLIASWPAAIKKGGSICHEVGHIIDLMPTLADLAGVDYPVEFDGEAVIPAPGISLAPLFNNSAIEAREALFWELWDCRAVRKGKWKLVTVGGERIVAQFHINPEREGWELYDIEADRCELNDLSEQFPEVVRELEGLWLEWFESCRRDREPFAGETA
jgi:arylsulfatase